MKLRRRRSEFTRLDFSRNREALGRIIVARQRQIELDTNGFIDLTFSKPVEIPAERIFTDTTRGTFRGEPIPEGEHSFFARRPDETSRPRRRT